MHNQTKVIYRKSESSVWRQGRRRYKSIEGREFKSCLAYLIAYSFILSVSDWERNIFTQNFARFPHVSFVY